MSDFLVRGLFDLCVRLVLAQFCHLLAGGGKPRKSSLSSLEDDDDGKRSKRRKRRTSTDDDDDGDSDDDEMSSSKAGAAEKKKMRKDRKKRSRDGDDDGDGEDGDGEETGSSREIEEKKNRRGKKSKKSTTGDDVSEGESDDDAASESESRSKVVKSKAVKSKKKKKRSTVARGHARGLNPNLIIKRSDSSVKEKGGKSLRSQPNRIRSNLSEFKTDDEDSEEEEDADDFQEEEESDEVGGKGKRASSRRAKDSSAEKDSSAKKGKRKIMSLAGVKAEAVVAAEKAMSHFKGKKEVLAVGANAEAKVEEETRKSVDSDDVSTDDDEIESDENYAPEDEEPKKKKAKKSPRKKKRISRKEKSARARKALISCCDTVSVIRGINVFRCYEKKKDSVEEVPVYLSKRELLDAKLGDSDTDTLVDFFEETAFLMRLNSHSKDLRLVDWHSNYGFAQARIFQESGKGDVGLKKLIDDFVIDWKFCCEWDVSDGFTGDSVSATKVRLAEKEKFERRVLADDEWWKMSIFKGSKEDHADLMEAWEKFLVWAKEADPQWKAVDGEEWEKIVRSHFKEVVVPVTEWVKIKLSSVSGCGVFTARTFEKGEIIFTYGGWDLVTRAFSEAGSGSSPPKWTDHLGLEDARKAVSRSEQDYILRMRRPDGTADYRVAGPIPVGGKKAPLFAGAHMVNNSIQARGRNSIVNDLAMCICTCKTSKDSELLFQCGQAPRVPESAKGKSPSADSKNSKKKGGGNNSKKQDPRKRRPIKDSGTGGESKGGSLSGNSTISSQKVASDFAVVRFANADAFKFSNVVGKKWGVSFCEAVCAHWGDKLDNKGIYYMSAECGGTAMSSEEGVGENGVMEVHVDEFGERLPKGGEPLMVIVDCDYLPDKAVGLMVAKPNKVRDVVSACFDSLVHHFKLSGAAFQFAMVKEEEKQVSIDEWDGMRERKLSSLTDNRFVRLWLVKKPEGEMGDWGGFYD